MKRAAVYSRYSTEISIEARIEAIRKYCQSKGYSIVAEYIDEAQSGFSTNVVKNVF